jgi:NAD(P)-dependent dehydrogenase (short-subunit alcohol dehydrogenase family)
MDLKLKDQHVFITGSAGGIGLGTAKLFLQNGSKVTLHYNKECDSLKDLIELYPSRY